MQSTKSEKANLIFSFESLFCQFSLKDCLLIPTYTRQQIMVQLKEQEDGVDFSEIFASNRQGQFTIATGVQ